MHQYNMIQKDFNGLNVSFIEKDKDLWLTGEQIGIALEYEFPRQAIKKIYERNKDELDEYSCLIKIAGCEVTKGGVKLTPPGGKQETRVFNEHGTMVITMLSRQPIARLFRKWAVNILKAYRHGELEMLPNTQTPTLKEISSNYKSALSLVKGIGLSKNQCILKAAQATKADIGIDVFEYLDVERPEDEAEPARDFYAALDLLLENGLVKNYCLDGSEIYVRMDEVFKAARQHLGMSLTKGDYAMIKRNIRFISSNKGAHNRLTGSITIKTWAFVKNTATQ